MVTEVDLLNHMIGQDHVHTASETIESIINHDVPTIGPDAPLEILMELFRDNNVALIVDSEGLQGILTKIDLLGFLSP